MAEIVFGWRGTHGIELAFLAGLGNITHYAPEYIKV
jgi:hypothetical protein